MAVSAEFAGWRRQHWYVALAAVIGLIPPMAAWWMDRCVIGLRFDVAVWAGWPLGTAAALTAARIVRLFSERWQAWWLAAGALAAMAALGLFVALWDSSICYAPDYPQEPKRFLVATSYSETIQAEIENLRVRSPGMHTPSCQELLHDNSYDPHEIFDDRSLTLARVWLQAAWLLLTAGSMAFFGMSIAGAAARQHRDALLELAAERLKVWPPQTPAFLVAGTRQAIDAMTLATEPNPVGSILTTAAMFEGRQGLLGKVAETHADGGSAERWKKWRDFEQQIDGVADLGLLRYDITSELHMIRTASNNARHRRYLVTSETASLTLLHAIHVIEWYAFVFKHGPRLPDPPPGVVDAP